MLGFVLVDLENYTPKPEEVRRLRQRRYPVQIFFKIFVGNLQADRRIDIRLASELQGFGHRAEYIFCQVTAKNAVDLLIASHVGTLAERHPGSVFWIVSKDKDFSVLMQNRPDIRIRRIACLQELPSVLTLPSLPAGQHPGKPASQA